MAVRARSGRLAMVALATVMLGAAPAHAVVLHDQLDNTGTGTVSQDFPFVNDSGDTFIADDFTVPAGATWTIDLVEVLSFTDPAGPPPTSVRVSLYGSSGTVPGTRHFTTISTPTSGANQNLVLPVAGAPVLGPGHFWIQVQAIRSAPEGGWYWNGRTVQSGDPAAFQNPGNAYGTGCTTWRAIASCIAGVPPDMAFRISGTTGTYTGQTSSTAVSCAPASVALGVTSTCTATVTDPGPLGTAQTTPTGTVSFTSNGTGGFSNGSCTLTAGSCSVTYRPGTLDAHVITGTYNGDATHPGGSGTDDVTATRRTTSTTVSCVPASVAHGTVSTCTATATDGGAGTGSTPTGTVSFSSNGSGTFSNGSCTLTAGSCSVTYTPGTVSTHQVTGAYGGDATHLGGNGTGQVTATRRATSTVVDCVPRSVPQGAVATCTVTATDADGGTGSTPTGTVDFTSNGTGTFSNASCTLAAGSCSVTYTPGSADTHEITGTYGGDAAHTGGDGSDEIEATSLTGVSIDKSDSADQVTVGSTLSYFLRVSNPGPSAAANVRVVDPLPSRVTFVSASATQGSCVSASDTVSCDLGTVNAGDDELVTIEVRATEEGLLSNTATVTTTTADASSADNSDTETTRVVTVAVSPAAAPTPSLQLRIARLSAFAGAAGRCEVTTGAIGTCRITLRAQGRVLARGERAATGGASVRVPLRLSAHGRRLLAKRLGGVRATVTATDGTSTATARTRAILGVERITTPPGAFAPNDAGITSLGRRFLQSLRGKLIAVSSLRCDGYAAAPEAAGADSDRALATSLRRARLVCDALRRHGVTGKPIVVAHGGADPIARNTSEAGRDRNRRVEITLRH